MQFILTLVTHISSTRRLQHSLELRGPDSGISERSLLDMLGAVEKLVSEWLEQSSEVSQSSKPSTTRKKPSRIGTTGK